MKKKNVLLLFSCLALIMTMIGTASASFTIVTYHPTGYDVDSGLIVSGDLYSLKHDDGNQLIIKKTSIFGIPQLNLYYGDMTDSERAGVNGCFLKWDFYDYRNNNPSAKIIIAAVGTMQGDYWEYQFGVAGGNTGAVSVPSYIVDGIGFEIQIHLENAGKYDKLILEYFYIQHETLLF